MSEKKKTHWSVPEPLELTEERYQEVLGYIREHPDCSTQEACVHVGVTRKDVRELRKASVDADDDYREARGYSNEQMVNTFRKLAIEGVEEPLVSAGKLVRDDDGKIVTVRKWSDRLLSRGLDIYTPEGKAALASKLGIEISGPDGGPIEVQRGVRLDEVLAFMQEHVAGASAPELEAPEGTVEIVAEEDTECGSG